MRLDLLYNFGMGTKLPLTEWPGIVKQFMADFGLSYERFEYELSSFMCEGKLSGCERAVKEAPQLGTIRLKPDKYYAQHILSNVDGDGCGEEEIMPLLSRIHRRWGVDSRFGYVGVNFFGENSGDNYIRLVRSRLSSANVIALHMTVSSAGQMQKAQEYLAAMKKLLPDKRPYRWVEAKLSEEDEKMLAQADTAAAPTLTAIKEYLNETLIDDREHSSGKPGPLAPLLKKLCKKYDYRYLRYDTIGVHFLGRRTTAGNYIIIDVDVPWTGQLCFTLEYAGVGFNRMLGGAVFCPKNEDECRKQIEEIFEVFSQAEEKIFELDNYYPATPDWIDPVLLCR